MHGFICLHGVLKREAVLAGLWFLSSITCTSQEVYTQHRRLYFIMSIDLQINRQCDVNIVSLTGFRIPAEIRL